MLEVVLVYAGLGLGVAATVALLVARWRRRVGARRLLLALGGAAAIFVVGAILPAANRRSTASAALDEIIPVWQFGEHHVRRIHASPQRVAHAIARVTARDIAGFRLLTWIRNPRLPWRRPPESLLAPPPDAPILDVALASGFERLREQADEVVIGTLVIVPAEVRRLGAADAESWRASWTAERFATLAEPGYAKAVMNFRWSEEAGGWTRLETSTRVFATDAATSRQFAVYWRLIYPGSSLIRRAWLTAIEQRAVAP